MPLPERFHPLLILPVLLTLTSCRPAEEIRSYSVERQSSPPKASPDAAELAPLLDHMLAAMVPVGGEAVFFKLVGKAASAERLRSPFINFLKAVDAEAEPTGWDLPPGWELKPGDAMRLATIAVPEEAGTLELTVTRLPMNAPVDDYLKSNVNRWLGQLGQAKLMKEEIQGLAQEVTTPAGPAWVIELRGRMQQSAMPRSTPAAPAEPLEQNAASEINYTTPDGWEPGRMTPSRKAAFTVPGEPRPAEVTVTVFPAPPGSPMAEVSGNVARWRGQLGEAAAATEPRIEPLPFGGGEATLIELIPGADEPSTPAMIVAMAPQGGRMWFLKLSGPKAVVVQQREAFRGFLESVRFAGR